MIVDPVPGGTYTNDWGAPRSGGRTHKGTDIFAAAGTPIVAPVGGKIDPSRWEPRDAPGSLGGIRLWLIGDDGRSYYFAHCQKLTARPGQRVEPGTQIATVGNTGNARTTPPHLHLGVTRLGVYVNPYPLLVAVRGGDTSPPVDDPTAAPGVLDQAGAFAAASVAQSIGFGWAVDPAGRRRAAYWLGAVVMAVAGIALYARANAGTLAADLLSANRQAKP